MSSNKINPNTKRSSEEKLSEINSLENIEIADPIQLSPTPNEQKKTKYGMFDIIKVDQ